MRVRRCGAFSVALGAAFVAWPAVLAAQDNRCSLPWVSKDSITLAYAVAVRPVTRATHMPLDSSVISAEERLRNLSIARAIVASLGPPPGEMEARTDGDFLFFLSGFGPKDGAVASRHADVVAEVGDDGRVMRTLPFDSSKTPSADAAIFAALAAPEFTVALSKMPSGTPRVLEVFLRPASPDDKDAAIWFQRRMPVFRSVPVYADPHTRPPRITTSIAPARTAETVFSFDVDEKGWIDSTSLRLLRATNMSVAVELATYLFRTHYLPATINGCGVRQRVQQPFEYTKLP
jgi:hypothetical protein